MGGELARRFTRCRALRRGMMELLAAEGATIRGRRRLYYALTTETFKSMTEAQAKAVIWNFLQCDDLTGQERAELLDILKLSETALTDRQRRQIIFYLQAEG